jgi:hypothetical protein
MKNFMKTIGLLCIAVLPSFASTITSGDVTNSTGTVGVYNLSAFDTTSDLQAGLIVQVTWYGGASSSCTWTATGTCTGGTGFTVSETNGANGTYNGTWNFTNSRAASNVDTITFLGSGAGNPNGPVAFNMCWNGTAVSTTNTGCVANSGTAGSNLGWTAATVAGGNGTASPTNVLYTNAMKLPTNTGVPVGDEFSKVVFTFANTPTTGNFGTSGTAFTWRMDSDSVSAVAAPEPATYGMVGLALAGLGALRLRKRKS